MASSRAFSNVSNSIENLSAKILEISSNPKPSYEIDGQRVEHTEFLRMLVQQLDELRKIQTKLQGPVVRITRGVPY